MTLRMLDRVRCHYTATHVAKTRAKQESTTRSAEAWNTQAQPTNAGPLMGINNTSWGSARFNSGAKCIGGRPEGPPTSSNRLDNTTGRNNLGPSVETPQHRCVLPLSMPMAPPEHDACGETKLLVSGARQVLGKRWVSTLEAMSTPNKCERYRRRTTRPMLAGP